MALDTIDSAKELKEGDSVYVYDQLWRAKIVEVADFTDGRQYKVHYMGFLATSDQWVDKLQLFPYSEQMKTLYGQIDRAEGSAFEGEYDAVATNGNENEAEEEEHVPAGTKKRRKTQTKGKRGSTKDKNTKVADPNSPKKHTRRSRSSSNTSTMATTKASITDLEEVTSISPSHYNNVTKLASDGVSEILSHRLFTMKQKATTAVVNTHATRSKAITAKTATTVKSAPIQSNETVDLSQIIADALAKCETAKRTAQEAGLTAIGPLLNDEAAKWSLGTINRFLNVEKIQTELPLSEQMQANVDKWKQEGGIKGLEAIAMERNIQKWTKAQEHLAKFVECLVEDL